jgi:DMSO/TMAO reductase YedYZ molybdopterin-dependent catalytic subunit
MTAPNDISYEELALAGRNHSMPLEMLRHDVTPAGLHYLLIHFDVPFTDGAGWQVEVGGHVREPLTLDLKTIRSLPAVTHRVVMECAGNGRARLEPRPLSQPWLEGAVGNAEWTGTPLAAVLDQAGVLDGAVEVVLTGADRGVQDDVEHDYERSVPIAEAMRPEVLLAYEMNGDPLLPQHGFPIRVIVPGWYGMTSVKWLSRITVVTEPFQGYQQAIAYRFTTSEDDPGRPVTRMRPRSLMVPPGIPDFFSRVRRLGAGPCTLHGRAWSGRGPIERVEVSTDGGANWADAQQTPPAGPHAWTGWSYEWDAAPGSHELCSRATDATGTTQPLEPDWNLHGVENNGVQRVPVVVVAG